MSQAPLREQITKCFGDTKMPEDDQFEPDVELFDIEATIDRLEALVASAEREATETTFQTIVPDEGPNEDTKGSFADGYAKAVKDVCDNYYRLVKEPEGSKNG